jgi:hypothetical protein
MIAELKSSKFSIGFKIETRNIYNYFHALSMTHKEYYIETLNFSSHAFAFFPLEFKKFAFGLRLVIQCSRSVFGVAENHWELNKNLK